MPSGSNATVESGTASAIVVGSKYNPSTVGESRLTVGGYYTPSPCSIPSVVSNSWSRQSYDGPKPLYVRRDLHAFYFDKRSEISWISDLTQETDYESIQWTGFVNDWLGFQSPRISIESLSPQIQDLRDRCAAKHRMKIKSQSVNFAQAVAERRQTLNMISQRLAQLIKLIRRPSLSKLRKFFGIDSAEGMSNTVLEVQYGWRPLVSDIHGLMEQLDKTTSLTRTASSRVSEEIRPELICNSSYDSPCGEISFKVQGKIIVRRVTNYSATLATATTFKELGGLNIPYLAYELVPYSFIIDWFSNVGTILNSLDAEVGLEFSSGCETIFVRGSVEGKLAPSGSWTGKANYKSWSVNCQRILSHDFVPIPDLSLKSPFSLEHALNAIALLGQRVLKK